MEIIFRFVGAFLHEHWITLVAIAVTHYFSKKLVVRKSRRAWKEVTFQDVVVFSMEKVIDGKLVIKNLGARLLREVLLYNDAAVEVLHGAVRQQKLNGKLGDVIAIEDKEVSRRIFQALQLAMAPFFAQGSIEFMTGVPGYTDVSHVFAIFFEDENPNAKTFKVVIVERQYLRKLSGQTVEKPSDFLTPVHQDRFGTHREMAELLKQEGEPALYGVNVSSRNAR